MLVFKEPLFYLITAPKRKSSDAGNPHMPNRSLKGVCMYRNTHSTHTVRCYPWLWVPTGSLGMYPLWIRGIHSHLNSKNVVKKWLKKLKCYIRKYPFNAKESCNGGPREQKDMRHRRKRSMMADVSLPLSIRTLTMNRVNDPKTDTHG